jgi:hypothetical protein
MKRKLIQALFIFAICVSATPVLAYTNQKNNFSIDQPSGWTVDETIDYGLVVVAFLGPREESFTVNVQIQVEDLPEETTLNQYVEATLNKTPGTVSNFTLVSEAPRIIDNIEAHELVYTFDYSGSYHIKVKQVVIVKNDKAFNIVYTALQTTYDKYLAAFDSSVETFTTNSIGVQFMGLDWWFWAVIITVIAIVVAVWAVVYRRRKSPSAPSVQQPPLLHKDYD